MSFTHLHVHNEYSQLDGLGSGADYAKRAKELGFFAIALTNHGNVDGCIKFQKACKEESIAPIIGCELYVVDDMARKEKGYRAYHATALVSNQTGWRNLLKILTTANLEGFYYRPRIGVGFFLEHCEGLVVMSACASSFIHAEWGERFLLNLKECIGRNVYLEVMPHMMDEQKKTNLLAEQLSSKHNIRIVATNDCHYPLREDAKAQEVLLAIQTKARWSDPKRWRFGIDTLYLRTEDEMLHAFEKQGTLDKKLVQRALDRTGAIAMHCSNFAIEKLNVELPKVKGCENSDETELLYKLVQDGFRKRIIDKKLNANRRAYRERIKEEFGLICELGFQRYFLIVWELIKWCKEQDIMTGPGRGSVGGCLVAYLLGITDVDPMEYGLLFSRFISPARIDLPDIDMDFEDTRREEVRKHLADCYGADNIAGLSTFGKMKGRAALRDVARVFEINAIDTNAAAKSIVTRSGGDSRADFCILDAFNTFEDGIAFKKKYPEATRIAITLEGQVRSSGQHAAAMCVSKESLKNGVRCNLCMRNGTVVANWDKYDSEHVGLMKLDVLGLSALTVLNETRKMVKKNHGRDIIFDQIPLDDPKVYEEIGKGNTVAAFQIGSIGLSRYCSELGVSNFDELVHATALWRPGTLRAGMTTEFQLRKQGKQWSCVHPSLEELTKETYGIILYQEQVMKLMYDLGGLGWRTCDTVRKVISKSQGDALFAKFKEEFVNGCLERKTLDANSAAKVWDELSSFGSYGFNKSHSVEYSMITYWDVWCKVYYPAEFMACTLTYGSLDKKEEYTEECRRLGLEVHLPKIGMSHAKKWQAKDNNLFIPFMEIKGVGDKVAEQIGNLRFDAKSKKGFFKADETMRAPNKNIINVLEKIKADDSSAVLSEEELTNISKMFSFNVSRDPMHKVRGIFELLNNKKLLSTIEQVDFGAPDKQLKWYFGKMTELRFGYRAQGTRRKEGGAETAGTAESMGGVYGFFKDSTQSCMLVFNSDLYARKKYEIEHCENQWILIKGNHPRGQSTLFCAEVFTEEELMSCRLHGLGIDLLADYHCHTAIGNCSECTLSGEGRKAPVPPSKGECNVVVLGEAPGREEDRLGEGFKGEAGNKLWNELKRHKLQRQLFHVTNVVKCWPKVSKTPGKVHISKCTELWLSKELEEVKPAIILALGNTAVKALKKQDGGISSMNATTEWMSELNAWVCWCLHPASVLYSPENTGAFQDGIKNFSDCLDSLGLK